MHFALTEEQAAIQETALAFAKERIAPHASEWDEKGHFPVDVIREIGPMNNLAPQFPLATAAILPLRAAAEALGSSDFSPLWAGQNATGCRAVPAATLTLDLARGVRR